MAHLYNIQFSSSADLEFNDSQISLIHIDLFHMCLTLFKAGYFYYGGALKQILVIAVDIVLYS